MQSSESQDLVSLDQRVSLPGCEVHRNGLVISGGVTPEQLAHIGGTLRAVNESGLWWWGDYTVFCIYERAITYEAIASESEYAEESLRKARRVSENFKIGNRVPVSWRHHLDALNECQGDVKKALVWLHKAHENKWSVSQMRNHMRPANAKYADEDDKGTVSVKRWIQNLELWERSKFTPSVAAVVLQDLETIANKIRARLEKEAA